MLHYLLQVITLQCVFLIIYDTCLRKETFFNWNRAFLLLSAMLSIVMPFIKIDGIKAVMPEDFAIRLPQVIIGEVSEVQPVTTDMFNLAEATVQAESISIWNVIFFSGMSIAVLIFLYKLIKLILLFNRSQKRRYDNLLIIKLRNSNSAFSFFHYVFLGDQINAAERATILEHEKVHVKQKHTLDLLLFEVLRIVFWFNPMVYLYQHRIAELHEYMADAKAVKQYNKIDYYNNLLSQVFETRQFSFVNPFFKQSLIKKRIIMLSKTKSKQIHILKYALLLPVVCTMLVYTASYAQDTPIKSDETVQADDNELSHEELIKKYHDQILKMKSEDATFMEINDFAMPDIDKYINSKTEYYKFAAYMKYIMITSKSSNTNNSEIPESLKTDMNRTYEEYVEWKHTEEAKETWENASRDGVLRLIVEDFSNWTAEEEQEMNHKLDMIERDDFFKKLLIVDMKGNTKMLLENPKSNKIKEAAKVVRAEESLEVPFAIVDQVPVMLSCQQFDTNEALKSCMSNAIAKHVTENFNTDIAKQRGLTGKLRIAVLFKINTQGDVVDVRARAPHPDLEKEAVRVINLLPQFKPGLQKGQPVTVPYSLPILFEVQKDAESSESEDEPVETLTEKTDQKFLNADEVPYAVIDESPVLPKCKELDSEQDKKKCTSNEVAYFVNKNFNLDLATKLGLSGRNRIAVSFKIGKDGRVFDVKSRAPHPDLEAEAIRVVELLPEFLPGKHNGNIVTVPYSLPIIFQVASNKKSDKKN